MVQSGHETEVFFLKHELLELKNVTKYYGRGALVTQALSGISFSVEKGEFTAVMGASGSGKSTLLHVIAAIDRVSGGDILVEGKSIIRLGEDALADYRRDKLGFIFQEYNLLDTLTVEENITLPLNLKKVSLAFTRDALKKVSEGLGLTSQLKKFPWELSGGQRQRAACARALITEPSLILADEPTGALDSANSRNLMKTFCQMNRDFRATILMVTHDAAMASFAGRILFLKDGKIWNEIYRGDLSREQFEAQIFHVLTALGGGTDGI
ncbi:MAG TPA: ABC transporter ATP-binding protein [Candidatus Scybalocola faecigallinarum]|uniref:ABC transporter ATP-binding protein n=1 Tax=Candidatus Scybalocola faecigallinarum TaxID=2840941 RepID=A0A9D1JT31_9FIRM|nr:ABC transporter ATP-binding protein [Candidatus Scybalocola faecigallinarum]